MKQNESINRDRESGSRRRLAVPVGPLDPALPISAHRDEILAALGRNQVLIIAGETGSGKTTQLPKICLGAGFGLSGLIGCTQPRRLAASAMAQRVAEELKSETGGVVGYQVRFRERLSAQTCIKFMTDGILLAEIAHDPGLHAYEVIIIDEAHERSLNIDFLLGYLKTLLPRRRDLKLIITSATIDTDTFSRHFGNAPVIAISGRGYPVDVLYQPLGADAAEAETTDRDLYQGIADAVRTLNQIDAMGDILAFLSGEREIREATEFLSRQRLAHTEILPLYARLSSTEQQRVFHPGPQRRIILSTNIAETSLTVPRVRFVIDTGLARISRYAHRSRIQRLPIEPVSQASANQRSGRCGRLGPGTCIRLYSEADFRSRPEFTEPEILRTSLGSVILRMLVMGLGAVEEFPFIDPPAPRMINDAYNLLFELGAIDADRRPTPLGRQLDGWPLDVRLGRMIIAGDAMGCLEDVLVIVSALSIQDPRERPLEKQQAADEAHRRFQDSHSDFTALLGLWNHLRQQRHAVSGNQFRKLCGREFLNWQRVLEWFDLYQQLRDQARESGLRLSGKPGDYAQVHQALLTGMLSHVGLKHPEDKSYQGARARSFHIFPGSGLFGHSRKWVMAAEIVETTRTFGCINAAIQPEWIERHGSHLLKRHYFDPHWSRRGGSVMAWEQVSLFGLVIVEKRRVNYAPIDPGEARRIFILEALVRGELDTRAGFMAHNRQVREKIELMEHKRRQRDVLADEHAQFEFFDSRVPADVHSSRTFEKWIARLGESGRKTLYLGHEVLMRDEAMRVSADAFPDVWLAGVNRFPLTYRFEPGHPADGVTVRVPMELLNTLDAAALQWLVPGLLRDKLVALIKSLPKPRRRLLTPVPVFATALLEALPVPANGEPSDSTARPLLDVCAQELSRMTGIPFAAAEWEESALPEHLRFRIEVVDEHGREIAAGRNLQELQARFGAAAQRRFMDRQGADFNRDGFTRWSFADLPQRMVTAGGVEAWPALVDQGNAAGLRLFDTRDEAELAHIEGVLRLLALGLSDKEVFLRKHSGLSRQSLLAWSALGSVEKLVQDLFWSSLRAVAGDVATIRTKQAFEELLAKARSRLGAECLRQAGLLDQFLPAHSRIRTCLKNEVGFHHPQAAADLTSQLDDLVYEGFLAQLAIDRLQHFPRYFAAMEERLRLLAENPRRDAERMAKVMPWWNRYFDWLDRHGTYDHSLDQYRWLIEEYRVSLFAQRLGTDGKVSEKRLAAAWQNVSNES